MIKKRYLIKFTTANIKDFDPNFEVALNDIKQMKWRRGEEFDFEVVGLFDGFVENCAFNSILNTFLKDIMREDSFLNFIYKDADFTENVKTFIINFFDRRSFNERENECQMDAFLWTKYWGGMKQFAFKFYLPDSIMTKETYENFMILGPDYILGRLTPKQIFQYVLVPMYKELQETEVLDVEEFKDFAKYQMGLA